MMEEENCADCKKKAILFTGLGVLAGAVIGIALFQVVKRGK